MKTLILIVGLLLLLVGIFVAQAEEPSPTCDPTVQPMGGPGSPPPPCPPDCPPTKGG